VKEIVQRSVVDVLLLAVKELKNAYEILDEAGDSVDAYGHYNRAAGHLATIGIDIDVIDEVVY